MTAKQRETKEYLSQIKHFSVRIRSKIDQIQDFNDLATRITVVYSDMPKSPTLKTDKMESAVVAIVSLELTIAQELSELVSIRADVEKAISRVQNTDYRTLLTLRYIDFKSWGNINTEMHYNERWVRRLHLRALDAVAPEIGPQKPLKATAQC